MRSNHTPNPGSDKAIKMGCTCPVMDNNHGKGFMYRGEKCFYFDSNCPLHCPKEEEGKRDESGKTN